LTDFHSFMPRRTRWNLSLWLAVYFVGVLAVRAQESPQRLPGVTDHAEIKYAPLALQARIQGQVRLQVITDGHVATNVTIKAGHPLLAQAAVENVRTWKFVEHDPGTFDVTFNFHFLEDDVTFLREPGVVEVVAPPQCCTDRYTLPEKWNLHLRNSQGTINAPLTMWTYHKPYGSQVDGYATGTQGQERELRNRHISGEMLGFDATLDDKYGQRLKFSLIGKMTGDRIKGVFLNYWGVGGEWTADRAKAAPEPSSALPPAQQPTISAGEVAYHEYVGYPEFATEAGIQGEVRLWVSTDSDFVTHIDVESGNPFLVREALSNVRTWRFTKRTPRSFEVTYKYELMASKVEFLKEPGVIDIAGVLPGIIVDNAIGHTPTEIWRVQFTSAWGDAIATISLGTSDYIDSKSPEGYVVGAEGKKTELWAEHQDGDMLGFDMAIQGPNGKPLSVSVLGKKTGDKISGVFLDYSGMPGTWTTLRQASQVKPTR
jgi:outer membrane biosynthesis protein TonB